jgi:uncharacterized repeat protein (TIGR03847 family)
VSEVFLDQPHHVTAGFIGVPGDRTFYVQAEDAHQRVSILVEKGQVQGIGELLIELLDRVDDEPATDWDRSAMALREPVEPRWRAGQIGAGLDPQAGRFVLELHELTADEEEGDGEVIQFSMDQDQARRLAAHALDVVARGRPTCQFCGRPTDPDGSHVCPATNGHGPLSR